MKSPIRALAVALIAGALSATPAVGQTATQHRACTHTYTLAAFKQAARRTYAGTRLPPVGSYGRLWRMERCQLHANHRTTARLYWAQQHELWSQRRHPPTNISVASWYDDSGATASGWHATYGVAHLSMAFGTKVEFCYPPGSGRCVLATVDDRGPYVGGREWDLNQNTAGALGFSGVGAVAWRIVG